MSEHTEDLPNTRSERGVVKVGDTIRKPIAPWTPTIHTLLAYLHESGFDFAPQPLGIDENGREVLTYIDGDTMATPVADRVWYDALPEAARRLRQLHDLTVDFVPLEGAIWRPADWAGPVRAGSRERLFTFGGPDRSPDSNVMCHGDWGAHNAVFRDGRLVGMIDWECARPEHRLWDIAWFALEWIPLIHPDDVGPELPELATGQPARLRLLCDAYALEDRSGVMDAVWSRLEDCIEWMEAGAAAGDPHRRQRLESGEVAQRRRRLEYLSDGEADFAAALK